MVQVGVVQEDFREGLRVGKVCVESLKGQSEEAGNCAGKSGTSCHWVDVFRGGG